MDEAEIVTLSPEKVTEPKLRYYFVTTEHKLDDLLLRHWINAANDLSDENLKRHLLELIELQMVHNVAVPPFNNLPSKNISEDDFPMTYIEMGNLIEKEKVARLKNILHAMYQKKLEREKMIGIFIADIDDQYMKKYLPEMYTVQGDIETEVQNAIHRSLDKIMGEVLKKFPPKEKPGEVLIVNVSVGTNFDKKLLENWLKTVKIATHPDSATTKNVLTNLLKVQLEQSICVPPFNTLPKLTEDGKVGVNIQNLTHDEILSRIEKEKRERLASIGQNHFKNLLAKSKRKGFILVTDYDYATNHKIIADNLKPEVHEKLLLDIELREDMIFYSLQELKESEAERKATQFKDEALGVLATHIERQKKSLIPELDVFTGVAWPTHTPARPKIDVTEHEPEIVDFIDFTSPPRVPVRQPTTPDHPPILGDFLALEGTKTPILTPKPVKTRRRLTPAFTEQYKDLLDTTPPVMVMGQKPLEPQVIEWWDTHFEEITDPLQPLSSDTQTPGKSFMETASNWIKHAQVHLSQRETKAGIDLYSDILGAQKVTEPISEPVMPRDWDTEEVVEEDADILIEGV